MAKMKLKKKEEQKYLAIKQGKAAIWKWLADSTLEILSQHLIKSRGKIFPPALHIQPIPLSRQTQWCRTPLLPDVSFTECEVWLNRMKLSHTNYLCLKKKIIAEILLRHLNWIHDTFPPFLWPNPRVGFHRSITIFVLLLTVTPIPSSISLCFGSKHTVQ